MAYVGNAPARSFISFERQVFTIVNSQTAYALSHSVTNENDIRLVVNNVVQEPGSGKAYTATGTALTLSAALTNGTDEMYCVFLGRATATSAPGAGSIGTAQLASDSVTLAKMASGTDGNIISYDASGNPVAVATGNDGQVLTSAGAGAPPVFETLPVGATNTPIFKVRGSNQTISHNTDTKMTIDSEDIDTDNCFDLAGTKRFVPNKSGKYFFTLSLFCPTGDDINYWNASVRKNNSSAGGFSGVQRDYNNVSYNGIIEANGSGDYFEAYCEQESGSNRTIKVTEFSAFFINS